MKSCLGISLLFFLLMLHCSAQSDSLEKPESTKLPLIRIDIDYPFLFSLSGSAAIRIYKKNYLGMKAGLGLTAGKSIRRYPEMKYWLLTEFAKFDLFHKFVFNNYFELDNGLRAAYIMIAVDGGDASGAIVGIYTQPMIGLKHLKIGTLMLLGPSNPSEFIKRTDKNLMHFRTCIFYVFGTQS